MRRSWPLSWRRLSSADSRLTSRANRSMRPAIPALLSSGIGLLEIVPGTDDAKGGLLADGGAPAKPSPRAPCCVPASRARAGAFSTATVTSRVSLAAEPGGRRSRRHCASRSCSWSRAWAYASLARLSKAVSASPARILAISSSRMSVGTSQGGRSPGIPTCSWISLQPRSLPPGCRCRLCSAMASAPAPALAGHSTRTSQRTPGGPSDPRPEPGPHLIHDLAVRQARPRVVRGFLHPRA